MAGVVVQVDALRSHVRNATDKAVVMLTCSGARGGYKVRCSARPTTSVVVCRRLSCRISTEAGER
jgi:hypothetical protein